MICEVLMLQCEITIMVNGLQSFILPQLKKTTGIHIFTIYYLNNVKNWRLHNVNIYIYIQ